MLDPIEGLLGWVLARFYSFVPNEAYGLGIAIILLTIGVMLLLYPLTAKQTKSMILMQRAAPEIKRIQAKYKDDRQKMNEEVMRFYQENKINPLAGCFPLVVQMPILFALFRLMREPFKHVPVDSKLYEAFCGSASRSACDKGDLPHHLHFLGLDLSAHATGIKGGVIDALPYFVLVGLVILTSYYQVQQTQRRQPQVNPQMAMIGKIMPIGFGIFTLYFPAGAVLYYFVSNLLRVGQQQVLLHRYHLPAMAAAAQAIDVGSTPTPPKSPPAQAGGGLRKLFQLPTATGADEAGNGTKAGSGGSASSAPGSGTASTNRPPQGSRRNARKRKRR
jgi:YidC/Oxa1 family membrane protein insertase